MMWILDYLRTISLVNEIKPPRTNVVEQITTGIKRAILCEESVCLSCEIVVVELKSHTLQIGHSVLKKNVGRLTEIKPSLIKKKCFIFLSVRTIYEVFLLSLAKYFCINNFGQFRFR